MSKKPLPYTVSEVKDAKGVFYCHHRNTPQIPVFGSIGDKAKANKVCREYNRVYTI